MNKVILSVLKVVSIVKSTLGPRGMDKLIEEGNGTTITNDGATVMKKLNIAPCLSFFYLSYIILYVEYTLPI